MKRLIEVLAILLALGLPVAAQSEYPDRDRDRDYSHSQNTMTPEDQRAFNSEFDEWQRARARNDRDDIDEHARRMQEIMERNNIPPDTPFEAIASANGDGAFQGGREYQRFSPEDQSHFDRIYDHWLESRRRHDRNDIEKDERRMQDMMARYDIPRDVPYDDLTSHVRRY
ncbi:MAG TPA: hypothetical protein VKV39_13845 [Candidatus Sulfotelmatobacter sp.]|nr:hypothetical protein [Candidatus Sulfotelmatobacter sp.]